MAIRESFLHEIWGHGVLWRGTSEQSTKVFSTKVSRIIHMLTHTHTLAHTPYISHLTHAHTRAHTHIPTSHTHTHAHTHISHLTHPHVHVPEDIFLILCFPCSLEGGVLGPHWKRDPCVVQYLSAELCPPRALGLDVGLGQCTVASTMALQTVEIWSETTAGLDLQQPACS